VSLQVGFSDHSTEPDTIVLQICNKLRFAMDYTVSGGANAGGIALPRSDFPLALHVEGQKGDIVTFSAEYTPRALTSTLAVLAVDALATGLHLSGEVELVVNSKMLTTLQAATDSCYSFLAAAAASVAPDPLVAAWDCVKQLEPFKSVVIELLVTKAEKLGVTLAAGAAAAQVNTVMALQPLNRVIAEWALFGLPMPYSFELKLNCSTGRPCQALPSNDRPVTTSQPQTSQPQTSQPQTSQPQTSQPQTSQPQTSPPRNTRTVDVSSTTGWISTSVVLTAGEQFSVASLGGRWTVDYRNWPYVGPSGYSAEQDAKIYQGCKMYPSIAYGTLLGVVGGQLLVIGSGGDFKAPARGTLRLRIHDADACLGDNDGSVRVSITHAAYGTG